MGWRSRELMWAWPWDRRALMSARKRQKIQEATRASTTTRGEHSGKPRCCKCQGEAGNPKKLKWVSDERCRAFASQLFKFSPELYIHNYLPIKDGLLAPHCDNELKQALCETCRPIETTLCKSGRNDGCKHLHPTVRSACSDQDKHRPCSGYAYAGGRDAGHRTPAPLRPLPRQCASHMTRALVLIPPR